MAGSVFLGYQNCGNVNVTPEPASYPRVQVKVQYCPENGNKLINFFGRNRSAVASDGKFLIDTDRDGLSDAYEDSRDGKNFGAAVATSDTDHNGYSDFAMVKVGYQLATQAYLPPCQNPNQDSDGDGLSDCDESLYHTDPFKADTDGDGIPDSWEIYFGLNPLDPNDAQQDADFDGVSNVEEIRDGTPVVQSGGSENLTYAFESSKDPKLSNDCSILKVSNIPILPVNNGNLLQVDVLEVTPNGQEVMKSIQVVAPLTTPNGTVFERSIGPTILTNVTAGGQ